MRQINIEMPVVKGCEVTACTYNNNTACNAKAITVGANVHPDCDTFFSLSRSHTKAVEREAGVGACKMSDCSYNEDFECVAKEIMVGFKMERANCLTYSNRAM